LAAASVPACRRYSPAVARPSQRRPLGTLFAVLALGFAGVAWAAGNAGVWVVAVAAAALAVWMATLTAQMWRR
jgi:Flp pilus assembly protein TadB